VDLAGSTVMPGFMDAHVHISMAPGAALRNDSAEESRRLRHHHLRAYLASGVTTLLDPAIDDVIAVDVRQWLEAGHAGPRLVPLGPPVVVKGGYVSDLFPPGLSHASEVEPHLNKLVAMGAAGVKLPLEPGAFSDIWKTPSPTMMDAVQQGARRRGLPLYIHAMNEPMYLRGLTLRPHAFVHHADSLSDETLATLVASKAYVISTLAVWHMHRYFMQDEARQETHFKHVVPDLEVATLINTAQRRNYLVGMLGHNLPWVPHMLRSFLAELGFSGLGMRILKGHLGKRLQAGQDTVRRMHRAGVRIVVGSDAGNWPLFPYYFHGPSTWAELELLVGAGLTPMEVIVAGTRTAATMMGLQEKVGTAAPGKEADLIVLKEDPLKDLPAALRSLQWTLRKGVMRTPKEWMDCEQASEH
jgi:imidazolonepropionase-like amidohydrolase